MHLYAGWWMPFNNKSGQFTPFSVLHFYDKHSTFIYVYCIAMAGHNLEGFIKTGLLCWSIFKLNRLHSSSLAWSNKERRTIGLIGNVRLKHRIFSNIVRWSAAIISKPFHSYSELILLLRQPTLIGEFWVMKYLNLIETGHRYQHQ